MFNILNTRLAQRVKTGQEHKGSHSVSSPFAHPDLTQKPKLKIFTATEDDVFNAASKANRRFGLLDQSRVFFNASTFAEQRQPYLTSVGWPLTAVKSMKK